MVWEPIWKPFDVEIMLKEMNLLWNSVFITREVRITRRSVHLVETKEKKKSGASKVIKVK